MNNIHFMFKIEKSQRYFFNKKNKKNKKIKKNIEN